MDILEAIRIRDIILGVAAMYDERGHKAADTLAMSYESSADKLIAVTAVLCFACGVDNGVKRMTDRLREEAGVV